MRRIVISAAFLALAGLAWAQAGGIKSVLEQAGTATPEQMKKFAADSLKTVEANRDKVKSLADQAEKSGKAGQSSCLQPKVATSRTMVQVTQLAQGNLAAALSANDLDKARHEYRKIAVSASNSEAIAAEAEQCTESDSGRGGRESRTITGVVGDASDTEDLRELLEFYVDKYELDIHLDAPNISNLDG